MVYQSKNPSVHLLLGPVSFLALSLSIFFFSVFAARRNKQKGRRRAAAGKCFLLKYNAVPFGREDALWGQQPDFLAAWLLKDPVSPARVPDPPETPEKRGARIPPEGRCQNPGGPASLRTSGRQSEAGVERKWCRAPGARGAGGRVLWVGSGGTERGTQKHCRGGEKLGSNLETTGEQNKELGFLGWYFRCWDVPEGCSQVVMVRLGHLGGLEAFSLPSWPEACRGPWLCVALRMAGSLFQLLEPLGMVPPEGR